MSIPDISELVIDTDDDIFSDTSSLTGARSFVHSLKSPSVFDRLSIKETYSTSTRKGRSHLIASTQTGIQDRRRSFPMSPVVEVRHPVVPQPSLKTPKSRSPPPPRVSITEEPKAPAKDSFFERMARTETFASAARKPKSIKDKVVQISKKKGSKKVSGEKTDDNSLNHAGEISGEPQKSFSTSSQSSEQMDNDKDDRIETDKDDNEKDEHIETEKDEQF